MPEPFAIPPMVTIVPSISMVTAASFSFVSVVIIAFAAKFPISKPSAFSFASKCTPFFIFSTGSCTPITPVEPINTLSVSVSSTLATSFATSLQHSIPASPVQALAIPELITITCGFALLSTTFLSHFTGAAFTTFVVKVPAASQGFWLYTKAISVLP